MWQDYWDIWVYDFFGGRERLAFAIAFGLVCGIAAALLKLMFRNNIDHMQKEFDAERRATVAARLGPNATPAEIDAEVARVAARDRAEALAVPEIVIRHAKRPADAGFYAAVRDLAKTKRETGEALIELESMAAGPLSLVETLLGDGGLGHMDSFGDAPPFRGWELRQMMERIGLSEIGVTLENAVGIQLHRRQVITDMMATGMPLAQALAHPNLPNYVKLQAEVDEQDGHARFIRAADTYFEAHYPWAEG